MASSYVFASNGSQVQVLSVASSLVERNLGDSNSKVNAFALSPSDPETIHIATPHHVRSWDWTTGAPINDPVEYKETIHALCVAPLEDTSDHLLYTICEEQGEWKVLAGQRTIYSSEEPLIHLSLDGSYVMAASATKLIAGKRTPPAKADSDEEAHFTFLEISCPINITCLAGRAHPVEASKKKKNSLSDTVTVAVGDAEGQIMLYDDLFSTSRPADAAFIPRILHWHRQAVASVKWSRDGKHKIPCSASLSSYTNRIRQLPHLWWS